MKAGSMRIYTDGSCRMDVGGWGWWNETTQEGDHGFSRGTTNQRMELQAALEAIDTHLDAREIIIVSDSAYLVNCFKQKWYKHWEKHNWLGHQGKPVANRDIWERLISLVRENGNVKFVWVKGHNGDPGNHKADRLAYGASSEAYKEMLHEQGRNRSSTVEHERKAGRDHRRSRARAGQGRHAAGRADDEGPEPHHDEHSA